MPGCFTREAAALKSLQTASLQILNTPWEGGPPTGNALIRHEDPDHVRHGWASVPWAEDGSVVEVDRCGACTLYPREVLRFRFHWQPGFDEEHQSLFDQCKATGWRHYLIRDPKLADHRMKRDPSIEDAMARLKAEKAEKKRNG